MKPILQNKTDNTKYIIQHKMYHTTQNVSYNTKPIIQNKIDNTKLINTKHNRT